MSVALPVIKHRHRVTFSYPTLDPLEIEFGLGGGSCYEGQEVVSGTPNGYEAEFHELGLDLFSSGPGTVSDTTFGYPPVYLVAGTYSTEFRDQNNNGDITATNDFPTGPYASWFNYVGMYTSGDRVADQNEGGNISYLRVWLEGPSGQQIDLINETNLGVVFPHSSGVNPPSCWCVDQDTPPDTTDVYRAFTKRKVEIDEDGNWSLRVSAETTYSESYSKALNVEVRAHLIGYEAAGLSLQDNTATACNEPALPYEYVRYVDRETDDTDAESNVYTATPTMAIKFGARAGTFNEQATEINLPSDTFTSAISKGEPFAKIGVLIERVYQDGTIFPVFTGYALSSQRNAGGRNSRVLVRCVNLKSLAKVPLGVPALAECAWTFTKSPCNVDIFARGKVIQGTISAIDGATATIAGIYVGDPPWTGAENDKLYHRGFLVYNGVRIPIREWDVSAYTTFYCSRKIPASWNGQDVLLIPGCDKSLATCRARWNNEGNFGGMGIAIPTYNPLVEQGS